MNDTVRNIGLPAQVPGECEEIVQVNLGGGEVSGKSLKGQRGRENLPVSLLCRRVLSLAVKDRPSDPGRLHHGQGPAGL